MRGVRYWESRRMRVFRSVVSVAEDRPVRMRELRSAWYFLREHRKPWLEAAEKEGDVSHEFNSFKIKI